MRASNASGPRSSLKTLPSSVVFAAYEALPPRWRRLVDALPMQQSTTDVLEYLRRFGPDEGYNRIVAIYKKAHPGWVPPEDDQAIQAQENIRVAGERAAIRGMAMARRASRVLGGVAVDPRSEPITVSRVSR